MVDFTKKSVSDPMLDNATKSQIAPLSSVSQSKIDREIPNSLPAVTLKSKWGEFFVKNKYYILALSIGALVIGILAFFAFRPSPPAKPANIQLSMEVPKDIPSTGDIVVKINISNQDTAKLVGLEMEVIYPQGASYISSTPKATDIAGTIFPLPDMQSGNNTVVLLRAKTQGSVGDSKKFTARLSYRYSNFNSSFNKEVSSEGKVIASQLALDIQGPTSTNNTQLVSFIVKYVNNSEESVDNGKIEVTYPNGFVFAQSDPAPSIGKSIWNIERLSASESGQISVTGTFTNATPGEVRAINAVYSVIDKTGSYHAQAVAEFETTIISLPLLVSQELDGHEGPLVLDPGDNIDYLINYKNNATYAANAVNIVFSIDSKAVDLNSIQAEGALISANTITWNASSLSNLESVNPGEDGTLKVSMRVKNPPVKDATKDVDIKTHVKIRSQELETYVPGNDLQVKISSLASISASMVKQSGPLPPRVGQTTVYTVTLSLKNLTNDFNNSVLTANLAVPSGNFNLASVLPQSETARVSLDPNTGKLSWNVGTLRAHTGDFSQPRYVSFTVKLNPSAAQVNSSPVLLKNIVLNAVDSFTSEPVKISADDITTAQVNGGEYSDVGRVTE